MADRQGPAPSCNVTGRLNSMIDCYLKQERERETQGIARGR